MCSPATYTVGGKKGAHVCAVETLKWLHTVVQVLEVVNLVPNLAISETELP